MAKTVSDILIKFKEAGTGDVANAFKRITRQARDVENSFKRLSGGGIDRLRRDLDSLKKTNVNSIASMRAQKNALMGLRDMADVTGNEFKQLTAEINKLDASLARTSQKKRGGFGGRLGGIAKGAGAIGAAGIYGGVEGAAGAAIGGLVGGLPGAITGGVVGAQVGQITQGLGEIAAYDAALERQRKALALVVADTNEYRNAQNFLTTTSKRLAIPQDVIVRQFTSLTASVKGAGKETADAEKVFKAIAAGIRGTGGNLEDMKSAMRAVSQVFSKGKVSAEELRQQLGERLPGAFTLFADSMGKTPAELDKALEQGKVTLDDFMLFADKLFKRYGKSSEILAQGPEAAGDRLQTSLSNLKDNLGNILSPIGALFQDQAKIIVDSMNDVIDKAEEAAIIGKKAVEKNLRNIVKGSQFEIDTNFSDRLNEATEAYDIASKGFAEAVKTGDAILIEDARSEMMLAYENRVSILQAIAELEGEIRDAEEKLRQIAAKEMGDVFESGGNVYRFSDRGFVSSVEDYKKAQAGDTGGKGKSYEGVMGGIKDYFDSIKSGAEEVRKVVSGAFQKMEDAIVNFVMTGKLNFAEFTRSILADMARIIIRQAILKPLLGGIFNFGNGGVASGAATSGEVTMASFNAMGNAYGRNGIQKFARGGVVHSPQIFPFKNGIGLMGEAGSEAILPLKRTKQGKLGVESSGGGGNVVNVSVNASGTSAQGNTMKANQLGKMIGVAIEAELIKQKRPGGILYT